MIAALVLLTLGAAPAPAPKFDLVCVGQKEWSGLRSIEATTIPVTFRLRIDTVSSRFCYDSCQTVYNIDTVGAKALFFGGSTEGQVAEHTEMVDRTTGEYLFLKSWADDALSLKINAKCTAATFSGFPEIPAKF
jgi:hypothetical protein